MQLLRHFVLLVFIACSFIVVSCINFTYLILFKAFLTKITLISQRFRSLVRLFEFCLQSYFRTVYFSQVFIILFFFFLFVFQTKFSSSTQFAFIFLIFLVFRIIQSLALQMWELVSDTQGGLYVEMSFIEITLKRGQALFAFCVFALDYRNVIKPFIKWCVR